MKQQTARKISGGFSNGRAIRGFGGKPDRFMIYYLLLGDSESPRLGREVWSYIVGDWRLGMGLVGVCPGMFWRGAYSDFQC